MRNKGPVFAPEGGEQGGVGGDTAPGGTDTSTILYGEDTLAGGNDTQAGGTGEDTVAGGAGEWQEYVDDPAKTAEENAAAKAEHDKTKPAEADPLDTVPEGEYALSLPDGLAVDTEMLTALSPAMKEAGITGKQANALAAALTTHQKAQAENWGKTVSDWATTAKKDPEIGGANWDNTVAGARRVIGQFGNDALKEYLEMTGAGNHPEVIRFVAKVAAAISEDKPTNTSKGGQARDAVSLLYPDDKPKG